MLRSGLDIMSPQWTNIIFKDRNQAYGAYQLRKNNASNTSRALIIAISIFAFALSVPTIINKIRGFIPDAATTERKTIVEIITPPPIEQARVIPPAVQQRQVRSQHDMIRSFPPVIRPDAHEDPPTDKELEKADPGPQTMKGSIDAVPPIDENTGIKEVKGTEHDDSKDIFISSEIPPLFPGGEAAFGKFLGSHIRYPSVAKENNIQGRVFIQFVVEIDGSLTDLKIIKDPGSGLGDEAVRVLKISPHWKPGIQNGKPVRVQFTVPVNFSLNE